MPASLWAHKSWNSSSNKELFISTRRLRKKKLAKSKGRVKLKEMSIATPLSDSKISISNAQKLFEKLQQAANNVCQRDHTNNSLLVSQDPKAMNLGHLEALQQLSKRSVQFYAGSIVHFGERLSTRSKELVQHSRNILAKEINFIRKKQIKTILSAI